MPEFRNLPGIRVYKEDGNLLSASIFPGNVALIIGTSPDGPLYSLYPVTDTDAAESVFDPSGTRTGTLLRGMYEALQSGASYVALVRVGAAPAVLDFLNGYTIYTKDASLTSGDKWKINYEFSAGDHILRIYSASTGELVYNSLTGLDTGAVSVYFTEEMVSSGTITVGSSASPVVMSEVSASIGDAVAATFTLAGTKLILGTASTLFRAGGTVVVAGSTDVDDDGTYRISYRSTTDVFISHKWNTVTEVWDVFAGFEAASGVGVTVQAKSAYYAAELGLNLTYVEKFEALAKAYLELESAQVDMVIPMDVYANVPNLVNNIGVAAVPVETDYLGKVYQFEHNGELFFQWIMNTTGTVADVMPTPYSMGIDGVQAAKLITGKYLLASILSETAVPTQDIVFSEADFAHQLATFCHYLSVNDNEASGVISMAGPQQYNRKGIAEWHGVEPTFSDADGTITVSGTGLLGYKRVVGSTGVAKGYFATASDFVDGTPLLDYKGKTIDIGRYISMLSNPLIIKSGYDGTSTGYIASAAPVYAGLDMALDIDEAPTNKKLKSRTSLAFDMPKSVLDKLTAYGYVTFGKAVDGSVKVIDAPTAALSTSDYKRRFTVKATSIIIEVVRAIAEPFIGKLFNGEKRNALEEQVNAKLKSLQSTSGILTAGKCKVRATSQMQVRGEASMQLELIIPGELRQITVYQKLSPPESI